MKSLRLCIILLFIIGSAEAQQGIDVGLSGGITNYFGDLGNGEFLQAGSIRPGMTLTVRNIFSPNQLTGKQYSPFNLEARFSWQRIGYDETVPINGMTGLELRNYGRGLSFRNDLFGFSTHVSYTYYPNRRLPLNKQSMAIFIYGGVGIYYGTPKADLFRGDARIENRYYFWNDGTVRDAPESTGKGNIIQKDGTYETDLSEWNTEGQGSSDDIHTAKAMYKHTNIGFPIGFGFRYGLNKKITLSLEMTYYKFLSDYLDDVSSSYATKSQIAQQYPNDPVKQEIAAYISDPTGKGTNGYVGPATSRRGNPGLNDSYSYVSLEVAYKINWIPRKSLTALLSKL